MQRILCGVSRGLTISALGGGTWIHRQQQTQAAQKVDKWEVVIGIEVHAQLKVKRKLLSHTPSALIHSDQYQPTIAAENREGEFFKFKVANDNIDAAPNTLVGLCEAGLPGALPGVNSSAIEQVIKTGIALNGTVQPYSRFDRKHYNYPDLPNSYQITQQFYPLITGGSVKLFNEDYDVVQRDTEKGGDQAEKVVGARKLKRAEEKKQKEKEKRIKFGVDDSFMDDLVHQPAIPQGKEEFKSVGITRIHVEHDSGKTSHDLSADYTLLDFNRAGIALMEIVSEPDLHSAEEAAAYVNKLQTIIRHVGSSAAEMDRGSMRCDVNISVRPYGSKEFGVRSEIKNLNSVRSLKLACEAEIRRQIEAMQNGTRLVMETRGFNASTSRTYTLRRKETEVDYRYFPDPDLPPLIVNEDVDAIKKNLPKLPDELRELYTSKYNIPISTVMALISSPATTEYFDKLIENRDPLVAANFLVTELFGLLFKDNKNISESPVSVEQLGSILDSMKNETISGKIAKKVLKEMYDGNPSLAEDISKQHNWSIIVDPSVIAEYCEKVLNDFESKVSEYVVANDDTKSRILKFFMGEVMKTSNGCLHPEKTTAAFVKLLNKKP